MSENRWTYERYESDGTVKHCPINDFDASVTGRIVFGVKQWFDENPEERIRRGWVKRILHDTKDVDYNPQTQYLRKTARKIDENTIEDVYIILDKSEEMLLMEDIMAGVDRYNNGGGLTFILNGTEMMESDFIDGGQ